MSGRGKAHAMIVVTLLGKLSDANIEIRRARNGENRAACPQCDHGSRDDALAVLIEGDRACWRCHRCQWTGYAFADGTSETRAPQAPLLPKPREGYELARRIWVDSVPVAGTLGERYLTRRACVVPAPDADVRFHSALFCSKVGRTLPALVCRVSTVLGNRGVGVHRIFLDPAGSDRAVAKMRLGGSDEAVCIRLFHDEEITLSLAIAEGVETGLSAARLHSPVWACIDAGQLMRFPVLEGVETLIIFADHDPAGLNAAGECADRWCKAGRHVIAIAPAREGADANDMVLEAAHAD